VGGHALITLADLKKAFEKMGLKNVQTFLASGNVVLESEQKDTAVIIREIESRLKVVFTRNINVIQRSQDDLKKLQSSKPFKGITVTSGIWLYLTSLSEKSRSRTMVIPYTSPQKEFYPSCNYSGNFQFRRSFEKERNAGFNEYPLRKNTVPL
jgi:uncharacterized protein YbcV (DUF1398 family)